MSHISKIELEVKSIETLKQVCKDMNFMFMENQKTYTWYGRGQGSTSLPEGLTTDDLGKCQHAIKVPGCLYEIGVIKLGRHYTLLWDNWSGGGLDEKLGNNAGKLKQAYAKATIRKEARLKGYRMSEQKTDKGIRLTLSL